MIPYIEIISSSDRLMGEYCQKVRRLHLHFLTQQFSVVFLINDSRIINIKEEVISLHSGNNAAHSSRLPGTVMAFRNSFETDGALSFFLHWFLIFLSLAQK